MEKRVEMPKKEKNEISHRFRALEKFCGWIRDTKKKKLKWHLQNQTPPPSSSFSQASSC